MPEQVENSSGEGSIVPLPAIERFFLADRDVGWVAGSASLAATQMSAGTFVGTVGIHYATGISFIAVWPGIWLGWLLSLLFIAPQLRELGNVTVPEFVGTRFTGDGADGQRMQALVATLIVAIYFVYTAAQYIAGAVVLETVLNVPAVWGMTLLVGTTLAYTAFGGMRASILSDGVQVLLMVVGIVVAVVLSVAHIGGVEVLFQEASSAGLSPAGAGITVVDLAGFAMAFGLGMAVAPYELGRVYAMKDPDTVRAAIKGSIAIQAVIAVSVAALGLAVRVTHPDLASPDAAAAVLAQSVLGTVAGGLLLFAVIAAILSTIDSILMVSASALTYDLYVTLLRPEGGSDRLSIFGWSDITVVTRATTVAAAVIPLFVALKPELLGNLVQVVVALYAALIAGTLFAPIVFGLHWRRTTTSGALAGIAVGCGTVAGWHLVTDVERLVPAPVGVAPPVLVGVLASTAALIVVSLATATDV